MCVTGKNQPAQVFPHSARDIANELRKLLLGEGYDPEPLVETLRKTFFWGRYKIWKKRKLLVRLYGKVLGKVNLRDTAIGKEKTTRRVETHSTS